MARRRWIQDPATNKLIPVEEWHETRGADNAPFVFGDIQPYKSVVDGSIIESRSQHRNHLRQHGLIEVGNEKIGRKKEIPVLPGIRDELRKQLYR